MTRKRVKTLLIANAMAGSRGARWRGQDPADVLAPLFPGAHIHFTKGAGDATQAARQAAKDGFQLVVAAGGDGTINEVANGLVNTGVEMGLLPLGTENVLSKERHIPVGFEKAAEYARTTKARAVDTGRVGDQHFLCFAGIGFDALVADKVNLELKSRIGALSYVMTSFDLMFKYYEKPRRARITVDGETFEADFWQIVIGNIQTYGGGLRPTPRASMHDGLLDLVVFPRTDLPGILHQVAAAATGAHLKLPDVRYVQGKHFHIECDSDTMVEVDGDMIGTTPIRFEVMPGSLLARF